MPRYITVGAAQFGPRAARARRASKREKSRN